MRPRTARLGWSILLLAALACDGGTPVEPDGSADPVPAIGGTPGKTTDQIEIRLDVQPDDGLDIGFTFAGDKKTNLKLDDDADPILPNLKVMPSLKAGSYSVVMGALPVGYVLIDINCTSDPKGGSGTDDNTINLGTRSVQVQLQRLERVVCTFVVAKLGPLMVTIDRAAGQSDFDEDGNLEFEAVFSNAVTGFTTGDITVSGDASVVSVTALDGTNTRYRVQAVAEFSGWISVSIPAGVATDASGQTNAASTSTANWVDVFLGQMTECVPSDGIPDGTTCT